MSDAEIIELIRRRVAQSILGEPDEFVAILVQVLQAEVDRTHADYAVKNAELDNELEARARAARLARFEDLVPEFVAIQ